MTNIVHIQSISQLHKFMGHSKPMHPAVSFVRFSEMNVPKDLTFEKASAEFYIISLKTMPGQLKYGRNYYDFEEGTLTFSAPNQVMYPSHLMADIEDVEGWSLFFHPDILFGTQLGKTIHDYSFFSYDVNEALHLSDAERQKIEDCIQNIVDEYNQNLDRHSQELIVSNLELLLNYCHRFYDRQFFTRKKQNHGVVSEIESLLSSYFNSEAPLSKGLPSVKYCADHVNLSPNYLSDLLKKETGKSTKEHIDYFLIDKAKNLLLNSELNISEIAYELGFEQPKSFSNLFKKKTGVSPKEFRLN
ncbi:helix-turn-helix domain-containing protein [bacterium SCSIO 12741]|nr:helix-turn-helix domain-containing protein [bacterium SCSIO 12741]